MRSAIFRHLLLLALIHSARWSTPEGNASFDNRYWFIDFRLLHKKVLLRVEWVEAGSALSSVRRLQSSHLTLFPQGNREFKGRFAPQVFDMTMTETPFSRFFRARTASTCWWDAQLWAVKTAVILNVRNLSLFTPPPKNRLDIHVPTKRNLTPFMQHLPEIAAT